MIVAVGLDVDDTFVRFVSYASERGASIQPVNLRSAVEGDWNFEVPGGIGVLQHHGETIELRPDYSYFCRIIDLSPHISDLSVRDRWRSLLRALKVWLDSVSGSVINRSLSGAHNSSKPLHESVLQSLGFHVPASITSSDRTELLGFVRAGICISKTVCGTRADTCIVSTSELDTFESASGPIHLQRYVHGADARIHVVGEQVIAQRVSASQVDYRRAGGIAKMEVFNVPDPMKRALIDGTRSLGLGFSGWDFKIDESDKFWCLEANPMPGYSPYDIRCDGAISNALIAQLDRAVR
jgi:hypothetical protein